MVMKPGSSLKCAQSVSPRWISVRFTSAGGAAGFAGSAGLLAVDFEGFERAALPPSGAGEPRAYSNASTTTAIPPHFSTRIFIPFIRGVHYADTPGSILKSL